MFLQHQYLGQRQLNGQDSVISFAGSGGVRGSMTGLAGNTNDIVFKTFNSVTLEETARFGGAFAQFRMGLKKCFRAFAGAQHARTVSMNLWGVSSTPPA